VLGTSSSETVLPHMIQKMERLGASKSVVGLVIPEPGTASNLDGTNIYMTLATLFPRPGDQHPPQRFWQELGILGIAMNYLEGCLGRHRRRFRDRSPRTLAIRAGHPNPVARPAARHRQVHERMPAALTNLRRKRPSPPS